MKLPCYSWILPLTVLFLFPAMGSDTVSFILPAGHPFRDENFKLGFEERIKLRFGDSIDVSGVSVADGIRWYRCIREGLSFYLPETYTVENNEQVVFDDNGNLFTGNESIDYNHPLPLDYEPNDLVSVPPEYRVEGYEERSLMLRMEALSTYMRLIDDARKDGVNIRILSAYRDAYYQSHLYSRAIRRHGIFQNGVAKPGFSEHQLGTACDLTTDEVGYRLSKRFDRTLAFQWLMENISRYGISLSYPRYKEKITGYMYEPWHFRYRGAGLWMTLTQTWEPFYSR